MSLDRDELIRAATESVSSTIQEAQAKLTEAVGHRVALVLCWNSVGDDAKRYGGLHTNEDPQATARWLRKVADLLEKVDVEAGKDA